MAKKAEATTEATPSKQVIVPPPNFQIAEFVIEGTAPYVQNKFSHKAREQMKEKQQAGSTANKGRQREA